MPTAEFDWTTLNSFGASDIVAGLQAVDKDGTQR